MWWQTDQGRTDTDDQNPRAEVKRYVSVEESNRITGQQGRKNKEANEISQNIHFLTIFNELILT